jgi:predicted O-methyltransferase YrrM
LELEAANAIARLRHVDVAALLGDGSHSVRIAPANSRHAWSLGFAEQMFLQLLIAARGVRTVFEIGTFNGGTTRILAESVPEGGLVVSIDLPEHEFARTQGPAAFAPSEIGSAYAESAASHRIRQERGDTLTYDFSKYHNEFDLVVVDGAHDYQHGRADSITALALAKPGAVIVWDDFEPYWHGLVHGVLEATSGLGLAKVRGTSLALLEV